jgi:hypothetical protein
MKTAKRIRENTQFLRFLDPLPTRLIINTLLTAYMAYGVYQMRLSFLLLLDTPLVKLFVILLIGLVLCRAPDVAFFLALAYLVSIQVLRNRLEALEGFTNGETLTVVSVQENGDVMARNKDGEMIEISKDTVAYLKLDDPKKLLHNQTENKTEQKEENTNNENFQTNDGMTPEQKKVLEQQKKEAAAAMKEVAPATPGTTALTPREKEMIQELKDAEAIPKDLEVLSLAQSTESPRTERVYKVMLRNEENKMVQEGTMTIQMNELPAIDLNPPQPLRENFRGGSPVYSTTNYTPQGGCMATPNDPMCRAVTTFQPELNAQGLNQPGPQGYAGAVCGALF